MVSKTGRHLKTGDIFNGIITYVVDSHTFYVAEFKELEEFKAATQDLQASFLENIFWIPEVEEKFLIEIAGEGLFRTTRFTDNKDEWNFHLIDTGEKIIRTIEDLSNGSFYIMPTYLKEIPPIAFQCKRHDNENIDESFGDQLLYHKFTFEVLKDNDDEESVSVNMWTFEDYSEKNTEKTESDLDHQYIREILESNDPVFFDVQVAVHGFHTTNDDRRCKYYDPKTGGCWKKGHCKLEHIPEIENVFRDTKTAHIYDVNSPPLPALNTLYPIKIISFISPNRFTCHYCDEHNSFYHGRSLQDLRQEINSKNHEPIKNLIPALSELVTVKIGEKFHRARIIDETDSMSFEVYLVDEGTFCDSVGYDKIFEYCTNLRDYPFFAVEMEIADLEKNHPRSKEAVKWIFATQQNAGPLKALVVENIIDIKCKLYDGNSGEVGKMLVEKGLAVSKKFAPSTTKKPDYFIPG